MRQGLAGRLRTQLGLERFTMAGADGAGGFAGGWQSAGSVWAEMVDAGETAMIEGDGRVRRPRWDGDRARGCDRYDMSVALEGACVCGAGGAARSGDA